MGKDNGGDAMRPTRAGIFREVWGPEPSLSKYGREEELCPRTFLAVTHKVHHSQKVSMLQEITPSGGNFYDQNVAAKQMINLLKWLHLGIMENRPETEEKEISGIFEKEMARN